MIIRIVILIVTFTFLGRDNSSEQIQFDKQSEFERVLVIEKGDRRYLCFGNVNSANQSIISIIDDSTVPVEYIKIAALGVVLTPSLNRALMIGFAASFSLSFNLEIIAEKLNMKCDITS